MTVWKGRKSHWNNSCFKRTRSFLFQHITTISSALTSYHKHTPQRKQKNGSALEFSPFPPKNIEGQNLNNKILWYYVWKSNAEMLLRKIYTIKKVPDFSKGSDSGEYIKISNDIVLEETRLLLDWSSFRPSNNLPHWSKSVAPATVWTGYPVRPGQIYWEGHISTWCVQLQVRKSPFAN